MSNDRPDAIDDFADDLDRAMSSVTTRRRPIRACGKACFPSAGAAKTAIRTMQEYGKGREDEGRLHPYFCKPCRSYHVGHR